jgi:mannose-6-phosphate isomerase-like protein (cupin superfamily)
VAILVRHLEKPGGLVSASESLHFRSGYVVLGPSKEVGGHATGEYEEIILLIDGTADVVCGEETETIRAPAAVLIPPRTVHNVKNASVNLLKYVYITAV